jgi:hypothetical protein
MLFDLANLFLGHGFHLEASLKLHCSCVFLRSLFVESNADIALLENINFQLRNNRNTSTYQNCIKDNFGLKMEDFYENETKTSKTSGAFGKLFKIKQK